MVDVTFTGEYEHRLDERGRVAIPAAFRAEFAAGGFIVLGPEREIVLFTPQSYQAAVNRRAGESDLTRDARSRRRAMARAHHFELDRQGRVTIPQRLREQAGLEGDVTVVGNFDYVEVWPRAAWLDESESLNDAQAELLEGLNRIVDAATDDGAAS